MGFEYQFLVEDMGLELMGLEFPINLFISRKSSSMILFVETVSESVFSLETISFLEIVRAAKYL